MLSIWKFAVIFEKNPPKKWTILGVMTYFWLRDFKNKSNRRYQCTRNRSVVFNKNFTLTESNFRENISNTYYGVQPGSPRSSGMYTWSLPTRNEREIRSDQQKWEALRKKWLSSVRTICGFAVLYFRLTSPSGFDPWTALNCRKHSLVGLKNFM